MGVTSRLRDIRPPLPAPTETDDGGTSGPDTDAATTLTTRTDKSSFEIPEDGSPITIPTQKIVSKKEGGLARDKGQTSTSLLIEYFEGSNTGDKTKSKPTVRVKVSQGAKKRSSSGAHDAVQITGIGSDRKPSYIRRISLGSSRNAELGQAKSQSVEIDPEEGNPSTKPPIEIEVLDHNGSDVSTRSRGLLFNPVESDVSSMPADSMIEGGRPERTRSYGQDDDVTVKGGGYLREPDQERSRSRSTERIAQKVMEKLNRPQTTPLRSGKSRSERSLGKQYTTEGYQGSDVSNNPKLLGLVKDTIQNIILPEVQAAKEDQRSSRYPRSAGNSRKGSYLDDGLVRRVSKSSSTPNISSKPKVVLNRDEENAGTVLSRGDSERRMRKSSGGSYTEDRPKSRRSNNSLRDAGAASLGAGILTAANLERHDHDESYERRRKRKSRSHSSRSRSAGLIETGEGNYHAKDNIPPLPLASANEDSERTRTSLASDGTRQPRSRESLERRSPALGVLRTSSGERRTPPASSRTPTRTPIPKNIGMSRENASIESPKSPSSGMSAKERLAAFAAIGVTGAAAAKGLDDAYKHHVDADGYGDSPPAQRKISSPVQSVSSLKNNFEEDDLVPPELRPRSAASRSSAGRSQEKPTSPKSLQSDKLSPIARYARRSPNAGERLVLAESTVGPNRGEDMDDFYEEQHRLNDQFRQSYTSNSPPARDSFAATNRDSYQTNPYPQDEKRWTMFTDDSNAEAAGLSGERDIQQIGANPELVHRPHEVESVVASLMDPSILSSGSPTKASYGDRLSTHLREMGKDSPPMYQGSTLSQTMPSQDRWMALKEHAQITSGSASKVDVRGIESPAQSPARSPERSFEKEADVPLRNLAVPSDPNSKTARSDDSKSDVTTNPSIIKGPLGGDATGKDTWPYTPEPASPAQRDVRSQDSRSLSSGRSTDDGMLAAAAAGSAAVAAGYAAREANVQDEDEERRLTPDVGRGAALSGRKETSMSPDSFGKPQYLGGLPARSAGSLTPEAEQKHFSKADVDEFNRAMDAQSVDERDDPFSANVKRARHISANSHGMSSPIYDSATGKGKDHIQSKDIVALMDHLTVRDAQRNARDTEILVTLVRSAAEMRQSFDEMKRFIVEQDRMIMQNTDRSADSTAQKVLGGPRPLPAKSSGTLGAYDQEDIQTKRKGVLRRALQGLTGGKSANDLAKVEGMLMQILNNVEGLKQQGGPPLQEPLASYTNESLTAYEQMRNAPDPGYEPESPLSEPTTPRQSAQQFAFAPIPRAEKQHFHSGYDGRPGSETRVSTVLEGDEDEYEYEYNRTIDHPYENTERLLTPTQEAYQQRELTPVQTPPERNTLPQNVQEGYTPGSVDRQRKHQSNNSSLFGGAKVSRWSKTTASSAPPDPAYLDSPNAASRNLKAASEASRSGSTLARYQDEEYELQEDDRLRSTQSLAREQEAAEARSLNSRNSKLARTPSPLIPSETSGREQDYEYARGQSPVQEDMDYELDDPKYQAVRNSLLLQHPQPRQGATGRHQNTLESQAHDFDDTNTSRTGSDLSQKTVSDFDPATWGSTGTAGLAKHRLSHQEPLSPSSVNSPPGQGGSRVGKDDGPLVPSKLSVQEPEPEYEPEWEPQFSNSGFSRAAYYSSPYGSGHLLEPIEEVRYSLETDSGHSPEPEIASAQAVNMRSPVRKITGPRPMGGRAASGDQPRLVDTSGTVRRKPLSTY